MYDFGKKNNFFKKLRISQCLDVFKFLKIKSKTLYKQDWRKCSFSFTTFSSFWRKNSNFIQIILSIVSWFLTSVINKFKHLPFPPLRRHLPQHLFPYKRFLRIRGHKSAKLLIETLKWHTSKKLQTRIQNSILFQDLFKKKNNNVGIHFWLNVII